MEKKLLKGLYDCFYAPPELSEQEEEVTACHKAWIEVLAKSERKLVLRIAGFELAWKLSIELHNDENERSASCQTRRAGARFISEIASEEGQE